MPILPTLTEGSTSRDTTDTFSGYNHNLKISDGEFYDTKNLSTNCYPLLSTRPKRGTVKTFTSYQGITTLGGVLAFVDNQKLYYGKDSTGADVDTGLTGITTGKKRLVTTGSYICIFPDGLYYNTANSSDKGYMGANYSLENVSLTYTMCNVNGVAYNTATKGTTPPSDPADGALWIDTRYNVLKQWSSTTGAWVEIPTVYTKITFPNQAAGYQITDYFSQNDGVTISGAYYDNLNGTKILYEVGTNYIVIVGALDNETSQQTTNITLQRKVPDMDYVIECQNRLWGCKYGAVSGETINEIYACALGDFKNWYRYMGISTDSYAASVGTDGPWTGAVNYLGYPTFFKEGHIHRVTVSGTGAHQISDTPCRGVPSGSAKSLSIINETLYYKGAEDVCVYQGGFPSSISTKLGSIKYHDAVGGAIGDRYYLSMKDSSNTSHLFVADITNGLWMREDNMAVEDFVCMGNEIYAVSGGKLYALKGSTGTAEGDLEWYAESGMLYYEYPDKKYVSRFNFRMNMDKGSYMQIFIEYDSDGVWREQGNRIYFNGTGTVTIPVRPRRCDHMRIKLTGYGDVKIYSIAKILEKGSDY